MRKLLVALFVSTVGWHGLGSPAMASPHAIHVTGSVSIVSDLATLEVVPQGQQCLVSLEQTLTYSGGLVGTSNTVGPTQWRLRATCEEVFATGGVGIASTLSSVEHFVGDDGREATFVVTGRNDGNGNFRGAIAVHGDLHGSLRLSELASTPPVTYEGIIVVPD